MTWIIPTILTFATSAAVATAAGNFIALNGTDAE